MEEKITFNLNTEDKQILEDLAREERLKLSSYCRMSLLKMAVSKVQRNPLPDYKQFVERREETH